MKFNVSLWLKLTAPASAFDNTSSQGIRTLFALLHTYVGLVGRAMSLS